MFKPLLLAALMLSAAAAAKPYPDQDLDSLLSSEGGYQFHFGKALAITDSIAEFAGGYPPRFDNEADQARAAQDAADLAGLLLGAIDTGIITPESADYPLALRSIAKLAWMSHNMDVANAAQMADHSYRRLIEAVPAQMRPAAQAEYGSFLLSVGQTEAAGEMLQAALDEGHRAAAFDLGLAALMLGDKAQALEHLRNYRRDFPTDGRTAQIIEAVEADRVVPDYRCGPGMSCPITPPQ